MTITHSLVFFPVMKLISLCTYIHTRFQDPWKSLVELKAPFLMEGAILPTVIAFCQENADDISATLKVMTSNNVLRTYTIYSSMFSN